MNAKAEMMVMMMIMMAAVDDELVGRGLRRTCWKKNEDESDLTS